MAGASQDGDAFVGDALAEGQVELGQRGQTGRQEHKRRIACASKLASGIETAKRSSTKFGAARQRQRAQVRAVLGQFAHASVLQQRAAGEISAVQQLRENSA